jgi:hypothetical protein
VSYGSIAATSSPRIVSESEAAKLRRIAEASTFKNTSQVHGMVAAPANGLYALRSTAERREGKLLPFWPTARSER